MSQNNRILLLLTYIPLLLLLTFAFLAHTWTQRRNPAANNSHGRYSAQQILHLSEPMGPVLVPGFREVQFTTVPLLAQNSTGTQFGWKWQVELSDREGNIRSTLLWDADKGLVEQVSQGPRATPRSSNTISCAEAVEASLRWLVTLRMVAEKTWRLEGTPAYVNRQWQCRFRSPNARAYVSVEACDGQLIFARRLPHDLPLSAAQ
jgi:hypothetical protein